jgi:hypothetical protein
LLKNGIDVTTDATNARPPYVTITDIKVIGKNAALRFFIEAGSGDLHGYRVFVNNVPVFGANTKTIYGRHFAGFERVELTSGMNRIEVSAVDRLGVESHRASVLTQYAEPTTGDLYFLGFGVSEYREPELRLKYAAKDVSYLAAVFQDMAAGYRCVHIQILLDREVTVDTVRAAGAFLKNATVDDTFVLCIAGHGVHDRNERATYYFLTHESDPENLGRTAADFALIEKLLLDASPRKKLFLMDTCESGEVADEILKQMRNTWEEKGPISLEARGARHVSVMRRTRSYLHQKDRLIYSDLLRRSGTIVFSAARGNEFSFETDVLQNGVFTAAVLEALKGEADLDGDDRVDTEELQTFVKRRVAFLTSDLQHPTTDRDNLLLEFDFPTPGSQLSTHGVSGSQPDSPADQPIMTWACAFGIGRTQHAYSVHITSDEGVLVAGEVFPREDTWRKNLVMKVHRNGELAWQRAFDAPWERWHSVLQPTNEGGCVLAHRVDEGVRVVKLTPDGDMEWRSLLAASQLSEGLIAHTDDGDTVIAGNTWQMGRVTKLDAQGKHSWQRSFEGVKKWGGLVATREGGALLVGLGGVTIYENTSATMFRLDPRGELLWERPLTELRFLWISKILETRDGELLMLAPLLKNEEGHEAWIGMFDAVGDQIWERYFGSQDASASVADVVEARDGGFVLVGSRLRDAREPSFDAWYLHIASDGSTVWERLIGGPHPDRLNHVVGDGLRYYVAAGTTNSFGPSGSNVFLICFRSNGRLLWARTFGGTGFEAGGILQPTPDGGFIIAANTHSTGTPSNLWIIKTNALGRVLGRRSHDVWDFADVAIER